MSRWKMFQPSKKYDRFTLARAGIIGIGSQMVHVESLMSCLGSWDRD